MDLVEGIPDTTMPSALDRLGHNDLCVIVIDDKHWIANWDTERHCFTLLVGSHDVTLDGIEEWWPLEWE